MVLMTCSGVDGSCLLIGTGVCQWVWCRGPLKVIHPVGGQVCPGMGWNWMTTEQ